MKNLNIRVSDELYWKFKRLQSKLEAKRNEDVLVWLLKLKEVCGRVSFD